MKLNKEKLDKLENVSDIDRYLTLGIIPDKIKSKFLIGVVEKHDALFTDVLVIYIPHAIMSVIQKDTVGKVSAANLDVYEKFLDRFDPSVVSMLRNKMYGKGLLTRSWDKGKSVLKISTSGYEVYNKMADTHNTEIIVGKIKKFMLLSAATKDKKSKKK